MLLSREPFFLRMAIWLRGLECWYLVLGGVAIGRGFEPQSDLELSFAKILIKPAKLMDDGDDRHSLSSVSLKSRSTQKPTYVIYPYQMYQM
jgi:hypothetical protein